MNQKRKWLLGVLGLLIISILAWAVSSYYVGRLLQFSDLAEVALYMQGSLQISSKSRLAPVEDKMIASELVSSNNQFAFDLYKQLGRGRSDKLFFSPYIISQGMAMAYAGAHAETASQISATMHFPQPGENVHAGFNALDQTLTGFWPNPDVQFSIANSLWAQADDEFSPEFLDILKQYYGTGIHTTDFGNSFKAVGEINNWIRNATGGKINDAISSLEDPNSLILVNAIYLNAKWEDAFKDRGKKTFFPLMGRTRSVPMMAYTPHSLNNKQVFFLYAEDDHYQIVGIPYRDGKTEMVIILPQKGWFNQVEASLSGELVQKMLAGRQRRLVDLTMPKFYLEPPILSLKSALSEMGMVEPFSDAADFSGIYQAHPLKLGDLTQKTYIRVDEDGTEAAAADVMKFELISGVLGVVDMIVDHPFIFFIRNMETGTILFLGRVTDLP